MRINKTIIERKGNTMIANPTCLACILSKQEKRIRGFDDEEKKSQFIQEVLELLARYGRQETNPWLAMKIDEIFYRYFDEPIDYPGIKHKYNQLVLDKEKEIETIIRSDKNPIESCLRYVSAGNYIDFGTVANVDDEVFDNLLANVQSQHFDQETIQQFMQDCMIGSRLVYCIDNCGEIVLDKVFIKILKEQYPHLEITAIVRGAMVINDATIEDAQEVGLTEVVNVIDSGAAAPGLTFHGLGKQARQCLEQADVILAKGQGNFEGLYGEGLNPYFLFLCKCELFQMRFGLEPFSPVFAREDQIKDIK